MSINEEIRAAFRRGLRGEAEPEERAIGPFEAGFRAGLRGEELEEALGEGEIEHP